MNPKLNLKYRNQRQSFEIFDDSVAVDLDTLKHKLAYKIPFDEIRNSVLIVYDKPDKMQGYLIFSVILNILLCLFIFSDEFKFELVYAYYAIAPLVLLSYFILINFKIDCSEKHIESDKILYFIITKKNEAQINDFIDLIFINQKKYYKRQFLKIDPIIPHHVQHERILRAYANKHITESEYEVIKEDLDNYFNFKIDLNN